MPASKYIKCRSIQTEWKKRDVNLPGNSGQQKILAPPQNLNLNILGGNSPGTLHTANTICREKNTFLLDTIHEPPKKSTTPVI